MANNQSETICWYCKRNPAYGIYHGQTDSQTYNRTCPWLENGEHIEGWEAKKGIPQRIEQEDGSYNIEYGYRVINCPLYERGFDETTYFEYLDMVFSHLDCTYASFHAYTYKYLKRYEKEQNTKVPEWVWIEYFFKKYEKNEESKNEEIDNF